MAIKNTIHLGARILGLTGLTAGIVTAALCFAVPDYHHEIMLAAAISAGAVVLALLFEIRGLGRLAFSRRGAVGASVALQLALATALVVGVNAFAFLYYKRFDLTRDHHFTIPANISAQLADLRDETDIVVYQQYVSFGQRAENRQDKYDLAAQRKIVEKVKDLAEQFQDLGPRFHVQVLDIQDDYYPEKFEKIKKDAPKLAEAIEQAPENSIFFYTPGRKQVQRLSFNDIYQLDKKASEEKNNLVLTDQGLEGFANKVFNIEERKPRVGFAVVHEYLGQEGHEDYGMPGIKQVFANRGFEGRDIILKKGWGKKLEPTVLAHEENRYEVLEAQRKNLERVLKAQREERQERDQQVKKWQNATLDEINKQFVLAETARGVQMVTWAQINEAKKRGVRLPPLHKLNEDVRKEILQDMRESLEETDNILSQLGQRFERVKEEQGKLHVEDLAERRRITDLRAKFNRMLADVDLLVLPRMTIYNIVDPKVIPGELHNLDDVQVDSIKDFIKSGKPVLFCLGPSNENEESPFPRPRSGKDGVEALLADFGVQLPNQAIMYDIESEALADRSERVLLLGALPEIPPVRFDWAVSPDQLHKRGTQASKEQPIRTSLKVTEKSFGKVLPKELQLREPRPVYYVRWRVPAETAGGAVGALAAPWALGPIQALAAVVGQGADKLDESTVILMSDAGSWNEDQPYPSEKRVPQYERPKADDPRKGKIEETRRGPFPIGVAFEAPVPVSWYGESQPEKVPTVRLAVLGHGGVFMGKNLTPMREKLLLDVSNWLLGRDELLARDAQTWQYPRVQIDDGAFRLWALGAVLGLPLLFAFLGSVVLLVRQMR